MNGGLPPKEKKFTSFFSRSFYFSSTVFVENEVCAKILTPSLHICRPLPIFCQSAKKKYQEEQIRISHKKSSGLKERNSPSLRPNVKCQVQQHPTSRVLRPRKAQKNPFYFSSFETFSKFHRQPFLAFRLFTSQCQKVLDPPLSFSHTH